jgi:hypothetical protein
MKVRYTDKTKPGGVDGSERLNIESRKGDFSNQFDTFDVSLQEIADLAQGGISALTDGNGTTANGTAIDLGGSFSNEMRFTSTGTGPEFHLEWTDANYPRYFHSLGGNGSFQMRSTNNPSNREGVFYLNHSSIDLRLENNGGTGQITIGGTQPRMYNYDGVDYNYLDVTPTTIYIWTIPAGATQVAAGVSAGELWRTSGHATLPDNVIMFGV